MELTRKSRNCSPGRAGLRLSADILRLFLIIRRNGIAPRPAAEGSCLFFRGECRGPEDEPFAIQGQREAREDRMKRRQFLAALGAGAGVVSVAMPAVAQSDAADQVAADDKLAEDARCALRFVRGVCQACRRDHRQRVSNPGLRRRRDRARPRGARRRAEPSRRDGQHRRPITMSARMRRWRSARPCRSASTRGRWRRGWCTAAATTCCRRCSRASIATASRWAIRGVRWAAGSARRSTRSRICRG